MAAGLSVSKASIGKKADMEIYLFIGGGRQDKEGAMLKLIHGALW